MMDVCFFSDLTYITFEWQVKKVDGVKVENLKHLCQLVENCRKTNLRFDLDDERVIVLNSSTLTMMASCNYLFSLIVNSYTCFPS
ncbi:hypothetical protein Scep_011986 [Stephania cephalantha]|uniref:Protease Do-like PDZ domain-containing protein n=1 Tax=Stephania cephalantha TaxID=152367 RepID=A0AAP0P6C6_9MAGN